MKKMLSVLCAAAMTVCAFMPIIPANTVIAADDTSFVSEQLDMPIVAIYTLGNSVNTKESYKAANVTILCKGQIRYSRIIIGTAVIPFYQIVLIQNLGLTQYIIMIKIITFYLINFIVPSAFLI